MVDILYTCSFDSILLCCLLPDKAATTLEEAHSGTCCRDFSGHVVVKRLLRMGYYYPNMEHDAYDYVRKCVPCQQHVNLSHTPPMTYNRLHCYGVFPIGVSISFGRSICLHLIITHSSLLLQSILQNGPKQYL